LILSEFAVIPTLSFAESTIRYKARPTMMQLPDGRGVHAPVLPMPRKRGENLTADQLAELGDLVAYLLVVTFGLSPADARRVMRQGYADRTIRLRVKRVSPVADRLGVLRLMAEVIRDVA
jgi:hypothetical protein